MIADLVGVTDGHAAGVALVKGARLELMIHCNPLVEDETLTLPERIRFRHLLQIVQDASLEVVDLIEPL